MSKFPPLRIAVLSGLVEIKANLDSLDSVDCPYDPETIHLLKSLLAPVTVEKIVEKEVVVEGKAGRGRPSKDVQLSQEDQEMIVTEIKDQLSSLNKMGTGEGLDTSERIQIAKTKTSLISELLKMAERSTTVQRMEQFKETVIAILDDLVDESGREVFMSRMEPYR